MINVRICRSVPFKKRPVCRRGKEKTARSTTFFLKARYISFTIISEKVEEFSGVVVCTMCCNQFFIKFHSQFAIN
jgi:hypothetical protein